MTTVDTLPGVAPKILAELPIHRKFAGALRLDADHRTVAGPFPVRGGEGLPPGAYRIVGFFRAMDDADAGRLGPVRIRMAPVAAAATGEGDSGRAHFIHSGALGRDGSYPESDGGLRLNDDDLADLLEAISRSGIGPELCEVRATTVELISLARPGLDGGESAAPPDPKRQLLLDLGVAEVAHSRDALLDHLEGTQALLATWGAREALCDAGLFHSVYGTESFQHPALTIALRDRVQHAIGLEAEEIVYLNHVKDTRLFLRSALAWEPAQETPRLRCRFTDQELVCSSQSFQDLINLTLANALEQAPRVPQFYGVAERQVYRSLLHLTLAGARAELERLFGEAE